MKKLDILLGASALLLLGACNREGQIETDVVMAPRIVLDSQTSAYTVKTGRELTIAPTYEFVDGAIYTWSLDGRVVGSDPAYTFVAGDPGRYYLKLEVATRCGTAREELRIEVTDREIPYVSLPGSEEGFRLLAGSELTLEPVVVETSVATRYRWSIDGTTVAETLAYTYRAAEKGRHDFRFEAENEDGSDSVEFAVQVCSPEEMPFSWQFEATNFNTSVGRTIRLTPLDIENAFEVTYTWRRSDLAEPLQRGDDPQLCFTPEQTGSLTFTVTAESPYIEPVSQMLTVHVSPANAYKRAAGAGSTRYCTKVYDITPAPGQFVAQISTSTDRSAAIAAAEKILTVPADYVSLGGWGGSVTVGFDHSIERSGGYDFAVLGNAFDNASEPGIVWVMQDENGNGLPDDTWYELRGSDYDAPGSMRDYAVTYYRPRSALSPVTWRDNCGRTGQITLNPHFPDWIAGDSYTLRGSLLAARNADTSGGGTNWENRNYAWGYADNYSLIDRLTDDGYNYFRISDAVDFAGNPVDLPYIDFVKVQCAVNAASGWLGEISTEVLTVKDYHLEQQLP